MLNEGTSTRSALAIADQQAYLGVVLDAASGWDASQVTLHTTTAMMDSALALMSDLVLRPSFPQTELERLRKDRLTDLLQLKDRPTEIADRAYAKLVFGESHPYGKPLTGTEASMQRITRSDLTRFWETYYRPNNTTLIVVGDVTPDDLTRRVERLFGNWQRGNVPKVTYPEPPKATTTTVYLIDKPGAPQSSVRIGGVGVPRSTEDYFALRVMNTILGEPFTSRLNQNLRETHGYTYGARSRFGMRKSAGPFTASAEVTAEKTDSSLIEFMKELRAIRDTVPTEELNKAKRYLQLRLAGQFETTGSIANQLAPLVLYDLPLDFYNTFIQQIERISQADVQRVAQRYLDPARMAVVIVGDRKTVESGLKAIKVGDVVIRDMSGEIVP
jgi:zinc protease